MTDSRAQAAPQQQLDSISRQQVLPPADLFRGVLLVVFLAALFAPAYQFAGDRYWLPLFSKFMAYFH